MTACPRSKSGQMIVPYEPQTVAQNAFITCCTSICEAAQIPYAARFMRSVHSSACF